MTPNNFSTGGSTEVAQANREYDLSVVLSDKQKKSIQNIFGGSQFKFSVDDGKGLVFQGTQSSGEVHVFNPASSIQEKVLDILDTLPKNYRITLSFTEKPDGGNHQAASLAKSLETLVETQAEFFDFVDEFVAEGQRVHTQVSNQLFSDESDFQTHLGKTINTPQRPATSTK